jgi:DeoR/GlpR family transcriptional regulator of sugar metabolism
LVLGAGGIDAALVISSADAEEARLNRLMRGRAGEVLVLADGDKFGRRLTYEVAPLARGMRVISDRDPGQDWRDRLDGAGVALELGGR